MLPSYYHSQTQIALWKCGTWKYVVSAEACGGSGQPQVMGLLLEWCVAYSWMSKSCICCRPGLNNSHLPCALPLALKGVTQPVGFRPSGSNFSVSVYTSMWFYHSSKHWMGCNRSVSLLLDHSLQSTEALRHNTCSATAALITAETLTVCCLSMLGPHFYSLLAISKNVPAWTGKGFTIFL